MVKTKAVFTLTCFLILFSFQSLFALPAQSFIEITNKRGKLQICNGDLGDIYHRYTQSATSEEIFFEDLKIVKINKDYYLLAKEQNSDNAYAFALTRYKGALILNTSAGIQVTDKGEAALRAALLNGEHQFKHLRIFSARNTSIPH